MIWWEGTLLWVIVLPVLIAGGVYLAEYLRKLISWRRYSKSFKEHLNEFPFFGRWQVFVVQFVFMMIIAVIIRVLFFSPWGF